jgi:hypothetical protein
MIACRRNVRPGWPTVVRWSLLPALAVIVQLLGWPGRETLRAESANWDEPAFDRWLYENSESIGTKLDISMFTSFEPGAPYATSRLATMLIGFDTSDQIDLVAPERYQLNSVRLTTSYVDDGRAVTYDPTFDAIANVNTPNDDAGKPIELYGVGFRNGYEQVGFGTNIAPPPEFAERSPHFSGSPFLARTANVFPIGDDGTGTDTLGDVSNSPGGEGVYEFNEEVELVLVEVTRDPWDSIPWAIGTVDGLAAGTLLPGNARFTFDIDLGLPGVSDYFRQSLSNGRVGVMLSSLHAAGFMGEGGEDFPAFYSTELAAC